MTHERGAMSTSIVGKSKTLRGLASYTFDKASRMAGLSDWASRTEPSRVIGCIDRFGPERAGIVRRNVSLGRQLPAVSRDLINHSDRTPLTRPMGQGGAGRLSRGPRPR